VLLWTEAAATDAILRRQAAAFEKPPTLSRLGAPLFGDALTTQDGPGWLARRGALSNALRAFDADGSRRLEGAVLEGLSSPPGVDGLAWLQRGVTAGLVRDLLGVEAGPGLETYCRSVERSIERVGDHMAQGFPLPHWLPVGRMAELARLRRIQIDQVAAWLREADTQKPLCRALLDSEPYRAAGRRVVFDEVNAAIGLGAHQAALALAFSLIEVLPRPELTLAARREREVAYAAVREALRLHPPFYALVRRARRDVEVEGVALRRGTTVMLSPWLVHRDADLHPSPTTFRIDRPEGPAGSYVPYGLGSRACPARKLLTATLGGVLSGMLRAHALRLPPGFEARHTAKMVLGLDGPLPLACDEAALPRPSEKARYA